MRCPRCGSEISDKDPVFCPRCGAALGAGEAEATSEIAVDEDVTQTRELETGGTETAGEGPSESSPRPAALLGDLVSSLKRGLVRGGWLDLTLAAAFGFLSLTAIGAVLVAAAKLQYTDLGAGAGTWTILTSVVIAGLGVLRIPVHIGDLSVSALPLGALLVAGAATSWAVARVVARDTSSDLRRAVWHGQRLAVPFGLLCWGAALLFRIRSQPTPVAADAFGALVLGAVWGLVFGAVGGLRALGSLRSHVRAGLGVVAGRSRSTYEGVATGGVMLGTASILAGLAALIWIVAGLLQGRPSGDFGPGEAVAAVIYLTAFGPNVLVSIAAIGLGAPVEVGAVVSSGGRLIGSLREVSLGGWGSSSPPWFAFALVGIPLVACLLGGLYARRVTRDPSRMPKVLVVAAVMFSAVLFEIAALAEARLGAGLVRAKGFGRVAPDAAMVALLAFVWAAAAGFVGWKAAEAKSEIATPVHDPGEGAP